MAVPIPVFASGAQGTRLGGQPKLRGLVPPRPTPSVTPCTNSTAAVDTVTREDVTWKPLAESIDRRELARQPSIHQRLVEHEWIGGLGEVNSHVLEPP